MSFLDMNDGHMVTSVRGRLKVYEMVTVTGIYQAISLSLSLS